MANTVRFNDLITLSQQDRDNYKLIKSHPMTEVLNITTLYKRIYTKTLNTSNHNINSNEYKASVRNKSCIKLLLILDTLQELEEF